MAPADVKKIKDHWQERARQAPADAAVTHADIWQRWLEIESLKPLMRADERVLDIGCGNGYTTRRLAPLVREVVGLDYSEEMIARARDPEDAEAPQVPANASFAVQDVLTLSPEGHGTFDMAISERCLINLADWERQQEALRRITSVIKPGGRLILLEGSADGREQLNVLREAAGLERMPRVWHNIDFDDSQLLAFLADSYEVEKRVHFGVYDFVARVVHPLLVAPEPPRYEAPINEIAARLALQRPDDMGDISRVLFLVLRRKTT